MLDVSADKPALRQAARALRDGLAPCDRAALSAQIVQHMQSYLALRPGCVRVGLYRPMGSEVDVAPLFAWCAATGRQAFAPQIRASGAGLTFVAVDAETHWRRAKGGFEQPEGEGVDAAALHTVFVPGLLFDDAGYRMGYGGGHYDRALLKPPGDAIGIGFSAQRVARLPIEAHDKQLNGLFDETGLHPARGLYGKLLRLNATLPRV